jgi:hypothetical protein
MGGDVHTRSQSYTLHGHASSHNLQKLLQKGAIVLVQLAPQCTNSFFGAGGPLPVEANDRSSLSNAVLAISRNALMKIIGSQNNIGMADSNKARTMMTDGNNAENISPDIQKLGAVGVLFALAYLAVLLAAWPIQTSAEPTEHEGQPRCTAPIFEDIPHHTGKAVFDQSN